MPLLSLKDEFTTIGDWWLPESPQDRRHGTLVQRDGETELQLQEGFDIPEELRHGGEMHFYPVVHGTTADGEAITLISAYSAGQGVRYASGGLRRPEQLHAMRLVIGAWLPQGTPLRDLSVRVPGLEVWLARPTISAQTTTAGPRRTTLTFAQQELLVTDVPASGFRLEWGWAINTDLNFFSSARVDVQAGVKVVPIHPQDLEWYLDVVSKLTAFLTIVGGVSMPVDQILASVMDGDREVRVQILSAMRPHEPCKHTRTSDFFLTEPSLGMTFPDAISRWFALPAAVDQAIGLARSVLASSDLWSHVEFLSLIQGLEGLHRGTQEGLYMDEVAYQAVRSALSGAIPNTLETDHKEALRSRIRYGNQISLSRRLTFLTRQFSPEIRQIVFGSSGNVPRVWIDTRNYYTHWDEELRPNILGDQSLVDALARMRVFLRITLLRLIGISDEALLGALNGMSREAVHLQQVGVRSRIAAAPSATAVAPAGPVAPAAPGETPGAPAPQALP